MEKMVGFVKNYLPVFMLGAVFGNFIELSGFSKSIVSAVIKVLTLSYARKPTMSVSGTPNGRSLVSPASRLSYSGNREECRTIDCQCSRRSLI
jgi:hypothetical protein